MTGIERVRGAAGFPEEGLLDGFRSMLSPWLLFVPEFCRRWRRILRGRGLTELRIRRRRSRILLRYLNDLKYEFQTTSMALKMVMLQSPCDRPDLASQLLKAQAVFYSARLRFRFRLWRYRFGLNEGKRC
jgi:hypothetical protein